MKWIVFAIPGLVLAAPAAGEVKSATAAGFALESKVVVKAAPATVYRALGRPADWWNSSHTYSGDAANLSLEARAGGCFCERLGDGGTIEHGRVVYAQPGAMLRLQGALGPLQAEAVAGTLSWTLKPVAGGTEIVQTYSVGGYVPGGAEKYAGAVDRVMSEQLVRLAAKLQD